MTTAKQYTISVFIIAIIYGAIPAAVAVSQLIK